MYVCNIIVMLRIYGDFLHTYVGLGDALCDVGFCHGECFCYPEPGPGGECICPYDGGNAGCNAWAQPPHIIWLGSARA